MIEFLVTALFIYGVHGTTREGLIMHPLKKVVEKYLLKAFNHDVASFICKPLFDCTPCMASVFGSLSFVLFVYPDRGLLDLPVWVFCLSGFNYILNRLF